ncbi:MAG: hypothetical protein MUD14_04130 [Hydrococcus sp. Prado102]|jgi:hypothetical protein|nr:hypothetical protein [Hydrococcus sp. Prado102]
MYKNKFYQQFFPEKIEIELINQTIVSEVRSNEEQIEEMPIADIVSYGVPTSLVLISTIVCLSLLKAGRHGLEKITDPVNYFSQVPCRKCRFFSSNPYLRCAVHPSIVLKAEAKDCSDYWPINGKFPS